MSLRRGARRLAWALAALALLAASPARAAFPPGRYFIGFAAEKQRLGTVPLLADVAEIEKSGTPDKIYVEDCRAWALSSVEILASRLGKAGYEVGDRAVPTVGLLVGPEHECCALGRFATDHRLDVREQPIGEPPFDVHEGFAAAPAALAEWDAIASAVWAADMASEHADRSLPRADSLADLLGSDFSFVLLGLGARVPMGRQIKEDLLDGGHDEDHTREFRRIVFAVVDLRRGAILWWDEDRAEDQSLLSWPGFRGVAKRFASHLP